MGLHMMDVAPQPTAALRQQYADDARTVYRLQGNLRFAGTETVVRAVSEADVETERVVLDLRRVNSVDAVSRRILDEVVRHLAVAGSQGALIAPDGVLPSQ